MGGGALLGSLDATFALASAPTERRLIVVILRGALDGLAAVPPYSDPEYRRLRGSLALPENDGILDLDGRFGLHPALAPLHGLYRAGEMTALHAVATPYRSRSHFDGQDVLENGVTGARDLKDGWLNRALGLLGGERLGLAVGQSVPLILRGDVPVASWAPPEMPAADSDFLSRLSILYAGDAVLGPALQQGLQAQAMADGALGDVREGQGRMSGDRMYGRAPRPQPLSGTAQAVGRLVAVANGARVAVIELGGWDTHANQGVINGQLANRLRDLGEGLAALKPALGTAWRQTAIAVVTEFGRTVAVNGTNGTDHGTGAAAFLIGGAVTGGRVVARWPGLGPSHLYEGRDLAPTLDLRAVMKGLLIDHLGLPADGVERVVFPDSRNVQPLREALRA
ncbi:MAG: DUF1501 domain-containing protein [Alphaproteobacteria bacterium]|nr:DUF1501 domain-containing protein [Alphaproteobacteria bacterium]